MNLRTTTKLACACLLAACASAAHADPEVGWWWNPDESGRGSFIESQGGIFYLATYLYADDGRARWLVSGGANADPRHWSGRLQEFHGGQTLLGRYALPAGPADDGAITVDFTDDTHGTITWAGGVVPIERDIFGTPPANYHPESGWWWNPAESGSGYSIEVQGNNLFFVGFMYDAAGNPVWYFSAGPMTTPTTYSGALQQFANGQKLTGAYRAPGAPATIGSLAVQFTAPAQRRDRAARRPIAQHHHPARVQARSARIRRGGALSRMVRAALQAGAVDPDRDDFGHRACREHQHDLVLC